MACCSAVTATLAVRLRSSAQPMALREYRSITTARNTNSVRSRIGDIRHPELVDGGHRHARRQVQIHLAVMLRIRRENVLAVANRQQVVFAHDPRDSFVVDDHSLAMQILSDTPVAVTACH